MQKQVIKIRKISNYTGLGLSPWQVMESEEKAIDFISKNQSWSGSFHYIMKSNSK